VREASDETFLLSLAGEPCYWSIMPSIFGKVTLSLLVKRYNLQRVKRCGPFLRSTGAKSRDLRQVSCVYM